MQWFIYLSIIFGLFLLIVGSVIVGSANKLDTENKDVKNARNSGALVLTIGIIMFVTAGIVLGMQLREKGVAGVKASGLGLKMKRYYF